MRIWLNVSEGAEYVGVSRDTIYAACERREMRHASAGDGRFGSDPNGSMRGWRSRRWRPRSGTFFHVAHRRHWSITVLRVGARHGGHIAPPHILTATLTTVDRTTHDDGGLPVRRDDRVARRRSREAATLHPAIRLERAGHDAEGRATAIPAAHRPAGSRAPRASASAEPESAVSGRWTAADPADGRTVPRAIQELPGHRELGMT